MIKRLEKPYEDSTTFDSLTPLVREWFQETFETLSPPQRFSIVNIKRRKNTLISSPTGSGKTLSSFLAILDDLIRASQENTLEDRIYCVYISPLKALGNDIEKNLNQPLAQLSEKAGEDLGIRVGVRTGDTTKSERAKMLRKPPHILITTPESFSIMLTSPKFRLFFEKLDWVIVDELHALADSKRGTHLSLALERLAMHTYFTRIGLSATISPLEDMAQFLVGQEQGKDRPCDIVDVNYTKKLDIKVLSPVPNMIAASHGDIIKRQYETIHDLVKRHKTTLIFTNTRAATERVVHNLRMKYPGEFTNVIERVDDESDEVGDVRTTIQAHHGSLSKERRLRVEEQLRDGKLRCVVSSTSLELGIDIGYIDCVILLGSPKSVARALQRIGRSGHKLHETAKGRIIVLNRDDLVECTVLAKAALDGKLDSISIPKNCLDVLAQEIYAHAVTEQTDLENVWTAVTSASPYKTLKRSQFMNVIRYLSGGYASLEERHVYAKIWYDEDTGKIGRRGKMARVLYMTNTGTIPDQTNVIVKIGDVPIGSVSEPFVENLKKNDVFVLGGETYQFKYSRGMTAQVQAVAGRRPTVPSWFSEMLPLSFDLAQQIQVFRHHLHDQLKRGKNASEIVSWIEQTYPVQKHAATSIYEYAKQQYLYASIPHDKKIVIEYFTDRGRKFAVFHTLYGRRVNDVLSRAVAYAAGKMGARDVEMGISDNGFYLQYQHAAQAKRALELLSADKLRGVMEKALEKTEVLSRRFRHCAGRAMMILRRYKGRQKTVGRQQVSSRILITAVQRLGKEFPIYEEAKREVLEDLMDIEHAQYILESIQTKHITIEEVHKPLPSPFAFNLILQGYADIMRMEERQEFLRRMHIEVMAKVSTQSKKEEMKDIIHPEDFSYEKTWEEEEQQEVQQLQEHELDLKQALYHAADEHNFPAKYVYETQRVIEGDTKRFSASYVKWIEELVLDTDIELREILRLHLKERLPLLEIS